ncbi:FixH family protein [Brevibacillus ginsengisoli]|uniref:FixH family protein n=1 Tax=Brevibacillus ginsengisoli TaxID=363854 RepID=UPI003CF02040
MKKVIIFLAVLSLLLLGGCGSGDKWSATINSASAFTEGKPIKIVMDVKEAEKSAPGLKVHTTLEMMNMDHGKVEVDLEDQGNGTYEKEVVIPMKGEWVATATISNGKDSEEKSLKLKVE